jgi:putative ABC transport system ATP-binding protein
MLLRCQNVTKSFRTREGAVTPLNGVTFSVQSGETVVITGKSGAGKSVLLSLLCGLDTPSSGEIVVRGESQSGMSMSRRNRLRYSDIALIFQNHNLIASWTVLENVEASLIHESEPGRRKRERAREILSRLGLGGRLRHLPHQLSMGEQQRVAVARALIRDPGLILADEPTGDVDPETAREVMDLLFRAKDEKGAALVAATHGHFPTDRSDRLYVLEGGRLAARVSQRPVNASPGGEAKSGQGDFKQ